MYNKNHGIPIVFFMTVILAAGGIQSLLLIGSEGGLAEGTRTVFPSDVVDGVVWPMYMGNLNHTGYSASRIPKENGTAPLWSMNIPSLMATNSPIVYEGVVYIPSGDGYVRGLDIETGDIVWEVKVLNNFIRSSVTVYDGALYFGARGGHLYGYNITERTKILDVNLNASDIESSPVINEGYLYIGTIGKDLKNHRFHAVDIISGTIKWTLEMDSTVQNLYGFKDAAAFWDKRVYIGDGRGNFYCLDADGFADGNDGPFTTETDLSPAGADIIWTFSNIYSIIGDPMLAEGRVYFGNEAGRLFCLDALTGENIWNKTIGKGDRSIQTSPSYHDGTVYAAVRNSVGMSEGGSVFALKADTGAQVWRFNMSQVITESSPVLADGALIFGARDSKVYCITTSEENIANDDRVLWYLNTGAPITSTAAIANGRIFVAREDPSGSFGTVLAFGSPDPEIDTVSLSDNLPFVGERITITAGVVNDATVGAVFSVEFTASNLNNSNQRVLGQVNGLPITDFGSIDASLDWVVEPGFDFIVAFIRSVAPKDMDVLNNFGSVDIVAKQQLSGRWTSSGGGPGKTGSAGEGLQSNRTYWSRMLSPSWPGGPEPVWYDGLGGNGTVAATDPVIYLTGPAGELLAINTTPPLTTGGTNDLWSYLDPSVGFTGRPALLVDADQTLGGSNKVAVVGTDNALWVFDWVGFWDGRNDGPYSSEPSSDLFSGDVIWRAPLGGKAAQPIFVSGGNFIVFLMDGTLKAFDDDTGDLEWSSGPFDPFTPTASDLWGLYIYEEGAITVLDPALGSIKHTIPLSSIIGDDEVSSISVLDGRGLISYGRWLALIDADPDDNGDGAFDPKDIDEGLPDNVTGLDVVWRTDLGSLPSSPPAVSIESGMIGAATVENSTFLFLNNGTVQMSLPLAQPVTGRIISGGSSFFVLTGSAPWVVRAFSPLDNGNLAPTWTLELESAPRGELVMARDHMFVTLDGGELRAIGALNSLPEAVIGSPHEGLLVFPGEEVVLDASMSSDPDGDSLTFAWYLQGSGAILYEGASPQVKATLSGVGDTTLVLRVYDEMRAWDETTVNITLLKRVTYPDFTDYFYDINVHMSYGISEPSGRGLVDITVPETELPAGAVFLCHLEFAPWPKYAEYRFEWANVTIGFADKVFPIQVNEERITMFRQVTEGGSWEKAPATGIDKASGKVFGNFSDLAPGLYAIGILDNAVPELRHRESPDYRYKITGASGFKFRVEYRDLDNDFPSYIRLVVDNNASSHELTDEGFATAVNRFTFYSVEGVELKPGTHSYYFETDDTNFVIRSPAYTITVTNSPPVPIIIGPTSSVKVGDHVLFDGSTSLDPDGDELTYSWDFDDKDGIQREKVDKKVDNVYYDEGIYRVTLTVSDGTDQRSTTLIVSVVKEDETPGPNISSTVLYILLGILIVLILAILLFILISRRSKEAAGKEPETLPREDWDCPECGEPVPGGATDCPKCGYEYDPLDFEGE